MSCPIAVLQRPSRKPEIPSKPQKPPRSPGKAMEKPGRRHKEDPEKPRKSPRKALENPMETEKLIIFSKALIPRILSKITCIFNEKNAPSTRILTWSENIRKFACFSEDFVACFLMYSMAFECSP